MADLNIGKILGPPGTGKTTEIMRLVDAAAKKYEPERVGVVSFTRTATEEIRARVAQAAGETSKVAKNVRTLHSHCFALLEANRGEVAESKISEFSKEYPEFSIDSQIDTSDTSADPYSNNQSNQRIFQKIQVMRNRMIEDSAWPSELMPMWKAWKRWMFVNGYMDFTMMLENVLERNLMPEIDILFVDEAQDLTPLQHEITRRWSKFVKFTVYAGDSDQSIFRFQGAIPEVFRDMDKSWHKLLSQSHRVSPAVWAYSQRIIRQARNREETEYKPTEKYGPGKVHVTTFPDLSLHGTHMVICRCNYQVKRWIDWLRDRNHIWHNPYRDADLYWNPTKTKIWRAARNYSRLISGDTIPPKSFMTVVDAMKVKGNIYTGGKSAIMNEPPPHPVDQFDMYAMGFTDRFVNGEIPLDDALHLKGAAGQMLKTIDRKMLANIVPNIIVGTIHSVKGGEADHVWLDSGVSPTIYREIVHGNPRNRYDEVRVAYVAATRARKTLGILTNNMTNPLLPKIK